MTPLLILAALALLFGIGGKLFAGGSTSPATSPVNGRYIQKSRFKDEINAAFLESDTPPQIIEAILWVESSDGADVKPPPENNSGELGVMQIIPGTVAEIKAKYSKLQNLNPNTPADSIMLGAHYLRMNFDIFKDWDKAIIAYNSGSSSPRVSVSTYKTDWYLVRVQNVMQSLIQLGG